MTRWVLGTSTVLLGSFVGYTWWLVEPDSAASLSPLHLGLFVLAVAVTELLPMRQPGGRPVATSMAVVATVALLGVAPTVVASVAGAGHLLARVFERRLPDPDDLAVRVIGGWTLGGLFALGSLLKFTWTGSVSAGAGVPALDLGAAALISLAIVAGMPTYQTVAGTRGSLRFLPRRIGEAIRRSWLPGVAVASTALLGGLVHDVLGAWTLPTMLIPLFAARIGLEHFADASRAYDQTIRAMSRLPEQLGTVEPEHGVRVGRLACEVGLELGLDAELIADLERAAHLHELGRIRLDDPHESVSRADLAHAGASIVRETASLDRVAAIIAASGDPRRLPGPVTTPARIVAACCEVDRYRPEPGDVERRQEMMVRLVRDIGDLEVISAVSRVLEREVTAPV